MSISVDNEIEGRYYICERIKYLNCPHSDTFPRYFNMILRNLSCVRYKIFFTVSYFMKCIPLMLRNESLIMIYIYEILISVITELTRLDSRMLFLISYCPQLAVRIISHILLFFLHFFLYKQVKKKS